VDISLDLCLPGVISLRSYPERSRIRSRSYYSQECLWRTINLLVNNYCNPVMKRVVTWLLIGHVSILFCTARAAMLLLVQIELLFVT
jgi:hypothetical protein